MVSWVKCEVDAVQVHPLGAYGRWHSGELHRLLAAGGAVVVPSVPLQDAKYGGGP